MHQAIRKERQRIRKEISEFETLVKYIDERPYKTPHLKTFRYLLDYCRNALLKDYSSNLDRLIQGLPTTEKSDRLREFRSNVKRLRDLLFGFLLSSYVPRELYCLFSEIQ